MNWSCLVFGVENFIFWTLCKAYTKMKIAIAMVVSIGIGFVVGIILCGAFSTFLDDCDCETGAGTQCIMFQYFINF